jgi:AcrR family transcriptional regulator
MDESERPAFVSRGDQRREAILCAARELFLENGYAGTSIGDLNRRAGGSRSTIYQAFGSKEALFGAIVADLCAQIVVVLDEPDFARRAPRDALVRFGRRFLEIVLSPTALALTRIVVAESGRFPELARAFFEAGPAAGQARVAQYLADQQARGTLHFADAQEAAQNLCDLMIARLQLRGLLGLDAAPDADARERAVVRAVDLFLAATER